MSKSKHISHSGIVEKITSEKIYVRIVATSQCAACHAKGFCSMSDRSEKKIEIPNLGQHVRAGDEVNVVLRAGLGLVAVWWAYMFPLVLALAVLLILQAQHISDLISGVVALAIIAVYYGCIWIFRDRFKKQYTFSIEM